uniref:Uncharacterized protein n=1 Tax=Mesocestoides corti TaxID=53468 RepID=A0A5K3FD37_MESCO
MEKTDTTDKASLTNHKPEPFVRRRQSSQPSWLRRSFLTAPHSCLSLVGYISSLHAIRKRRQRQTNVVQYVCALSRRYSAFISIPSTLIEIK